MKVFEYVWTWLACVGFLFTVVSISYVGFVFK
jgi:hypothetical protein